MRVLLFGLLLLCSQVSFAADLQLAEGLQINSEYLGEKRNIFVKLPKQYSSEKASYPVLYVLHGQWDMLSTLSVLDLLEGKIPNFIVVGIESRGKELSPDHGKATPFAHFLSKELITYVNQNYRTAPYRILSGHSNSGRFVLDYWMNNRSSFSQYFAFSPSLDDGYIVEQVNKMKGENLKNHVPLIVTMANEGEHMQTPFKELSQKLMKVSETSFLFHSFPKQSHRTTKHPSMQYSLQTTFAGWEPSYELKISGIDGLAMHYESLSKKFGFDVTVPNETLQRLTAHYAISSDEQSKQALKEHITFAIKQTPEGLDSMFEIAEYLLGNGFKEAGEIVFNEICVQAKDNQKCLS